MLLLLEIRCRLQMHRKWLWCSWKPLEWKEQNEERCQVHFRMNDGRDAGKRERSVWALERWTGLCSSGVQHPPSTHRPLLQSPGLQRD